jgi:hypothetical protein
MLFEVSEPWQATAEVEDANLSSPPQIPKTYEISGTKKGCRM